jgi:hypothetical protein
VEAHDKSVANSDPTKHNVHMESLTVADGTSAQALAAVKPSHLPGPQSGPDTRQFQSPATMLPIRCNNHPWMKAFLNISPNPFFAVSDAGGLYTISEGGPACRGPSFEHTLAQHSAICASHHLDKPSAAA